VNQPKGQPAPLELKHRILPAGEAAVEIAGELDVDTADEAFLYVQQIINRHRGPVAVSLAGVTFCDARGLRALIRMSNCADQAGCPFRVTSASPRLATLMRLTGLDGKFMAAS
jgi:anti-anti-sigma factor